jgi:Domain of unknown function (DUF4410)
MRLFSSVQSYARTCTIGALSLVLAGCATVSVTPEAIRPPDPSVAYNAIEAEPTFPAQIQIRDFEFASSSVTANRSVFHRAIDLFRSSSAYDRRIAIGRDAAVTISEETAKRLGKTGLGATRIASDDDVALRGNFLLVSGRLTEVDEGNRLTRVAFGLGLGESRLATKVHVFRVVNGEKAEVLAFSTHANSGKMPGMAASMGFGALVLGPITALTAIEDALSSGQKIYSSQIEYLASETGDQVARYLSQYSAEEHWIPRSKAKSVHLAG